MKRMPLSPELLAEIDRFAEMGSRLRSDAQPLEFGTIAWLFVGALLTAGAIAAAFYARTFLLRGTPAYRARQLFANLCRAHELQRADRRRLERLARFHGLGSAAEMFVRPELFELPNLASIHHRDWPAHLKLRDRLFAHRVAN